MFTSFKNVSTYLITLKGQGVPPKDVDKGQTISFKTKEEYMPYHDACQAYLLEKFFVVTSKEKADAPKENTPKPAPAKPVEKKEEPKPEVKAEPVKEEKKEEPKKNVIKPSNKKK